MKKMECPICKNGHAQAGLVTFTLERGEGLVVFKNVPAQVCDNCGDFFLNSKTTQMLLDRANKVLEKGVEIEVINLNKQAA